MPQQHSDGHGRGQCEGSRMRIVKFIEAGMDESTVQVPPPAATAARRVLVVVLAATTGKKLLEKNIAADTTIKDLRRMVFIQGSALARFR